MSSISSPRESLAEILTLERKGDSEYVVRLEDFWGEASGGDALARAALAAAESCPGQELRSLHASYLRALPPGVALRLRVEPLADGEDGAVRRVRIEGDGLLCSVTARFGPPGEGTAYQDAAIAPGLPAPDELPSTHEQARAEGWSDYAHGPLEFRRAHPRVWPDPEGDTSGGHLTWLRPRAPLPADARVQTAALVFLADFYSHWPFERRIGRTFGYGHFRPLDHALWLHRTPRWDGWWLLESTSEVAHAGVALARRRIFTRDGTLLATAAQAALVAG